MANFTTNTLVITQNERSEHPDTKTVGLTAKENSNRRQTGFGEQGKTYTVRTGATEQRSSITVSEINKLINSMTRNIARANNRCIRIIQYSTTGRNTNV